MVHAKKTNRFYTDKEKADLDIKTGTNKIGEIINLSQELNSQLWDRLAKGETIESLNDLYCDIAKLSTLSGIEIDKAKKEFVIDSVKEMRKIKEKHIKNSEKYNKKPYFFRILSGFKGYVLKDAENYMHYDTSMDYLQEITEDFIKDTRLYRKKNDFIPFSNVLNFDDYDYNKIDWWQIKRIIESVHKYKSDSIHIWNNHTTDHIEKINESNDLKKQCVEYINKIKMNKSTMLYLLKSIESPSNSSIRRFLFDIFFSTPNDSFFNLIRNSQEKMGVLVRNDSGNINIYGELYSISYKN